MTRPATILQPIAQPGDPAWTHRPDARSTLAAPVEILEATDKPAPGLVEQWRVAADLLIATPGNPTMDGTIAAVPRKCADDLAAQLTA